MFCEDWIVSSCWIDLQSCVKCNSWQSPSCAFTRSRTDKPRKHEKSDCCFIISTSMSCKTQEMSETCFLSQSELTASTDNNLHINEYFLFWGDLCFCWNVAVYTCCFQRLPLVLKTVIKNRLTCDFVLICSGKVNILIDSTMQRRFRRFKR